MSNGLPSRPVVTIAYRQSAYEQSEIASAAEMLEPFAQADLEPLALALMGGASELLVSITFAEPLLASGAASPPVSTALHEVCSALADWYARLARNRPCSPELVGLRIEGRDVRLDISSDLSPEACIEAREIRAVPRVFRQVAPRVAALLEAHPVRIVSISLHCDPMTAGGGTCVIGRYWEVCEQEDEPYLLVDSWRERVYVRR